MQRYSHWIYGREFSSIADKWIDCENPFDRSIWAQVPAGTAQDADYAVDIAHAAMHSGPWSKMSATERGKILVRISELLLQETDALAQIEVRDNGKLLAEMRGQLGFSAELWRYYGGLADKIEGSVLPLEKQDMFGMTMRVPVGVVAAITAWNSPLTFLALKCAPALAAGCAVVVKPSEYSTASSLEFAKLTKKAGLPDGVLNVISGYGHEVGPSLVENPKVAMITFTGSDGTGARIYEAAARHMKRVTMELGGKSPNIVFEDADLDAAANGAISGIFGAAGQMCTAGSRLLVQNSIKDEFIDKIVRASRSVKVGNPMNADTQMGPISNKAQFDKVLEYIAIAHADGATCVAGGNALNNNVLNKGYFVEPTVFTDVTNDMRIAQEEVFGPILSIIGFDDEEEAINIGNDIAYGLAAGVWTRDIGRLLRVSKALEAGMVWGNTYRSYSYTMPTGGMKRSGIGREHGAEAINEFLETKSLMINISSTSGGSSFVPK
ncbi:aldehyde dehydrogenase [Donghicola mangrovi]|uniref:Aldehyde dehydrogenase n=1 Tax=Donghicola mangrovi TaxID=2729614 RepID=A0A850QEQ4_9RHOB|nr:aldehyde dehydrogenase [Donghicola mangrovi]NVO25430.1 aldehyde dehydrogenase [Donghicola mangrovi]